MLEIKNIDKYYDKGKSNELHVLKDITLSLPDKGLVSFFGPSGCGKTTLLNVIGGLDKATGTIAYADFKLEKYDAKTIDFYRNQHISYIFQNYLLLPDITVYENLRLALEVMGILDKEEVDKRIVYALKSVGMYKYRKKLAGALSGGQQQRVAIARALLKKVKLILADEPTGNLDRKNSIEVMNILKKISEKTLVLLVTHSKELAEFYSDQIILLKDGAIDKVKAAEGTTLNHLTSDTIYLGDLAKKEAKTDAYSFTIYQETENKVEVRLIEKNGKLYIDSNLPIQLIDKTVTINEGKYESLKREVVQDFDFDIDWYQESEFAKVSFWQKFKSSFKSFIHSGRKIKFFNLCFLIMGVIFAVATILFANSIYYDKNVMYLDNKYQLTAFDYDDSGYLKDALAKAYQNDYISNYTSVSSTDISFINKEGFLATSNINLNFAPMLFPWDVDKLNKGALPEEKCEVAISQGLADSIKSKTGLNEEEILNQYLQFNYDQSYKITGISNESGVAVYITPLAYANYSHGHIENIETNYLYAGALNYNVVAGRDIVDTGSEILALDGFGYEVYDIIESEYQVFRIVGLVNSQDLAGYSNSLLFGDESIISSLKSISNHQIFFQPVKKDIVISKGENITNANECLAPEYYNINIGDYYNDYKVVGLYRADVNTYADAILISEKDYLADLNNGSLYSSFSVNNLEKLEELLAGKAQVDTIYNIRINENKEERNINLIGYGSVALLLAVVTMIYIYFIMRSKMIAVRYQIAVLRNIGASKRYVYRDFIVDLLVITLFTNLIGYLICYLFYFGLAKSVNSALGLAIVSTNIGVFLGGIIILFVINFTVGLLPVRRYLKKTPAEITALYDI